MKEFIRNVKRLIPGRTTDTVLIIIALVLWVAVVIGVVVTVT